MFKKSFLQKKFNRLFYPKSERVSLPQIIMIEPSNICNLKCSMCYVQQHLKNQNSLPFHGFQSIMSQFPIVRELIFCGIGEPFLNKDLFTMVDYAKRRNIPFINLITNGKLLTEDISGQIVKSGISRIQISVHSFNPEIFSKIRNEDASNLEKLKENTKNLIAIRNKFNSPLKVYCNAVINKFNYGELVEFVEKAKDLGVDGAEFIQMITACGNLKDINVPLDDMARIIKMVRRQAHKFNLEVSFLSGNYYGRCYQLWDFIMIHADGNISPCSGIFPTENMKIGNIFCNSIEEIWNSEKYQELRNLVTEGELQNCRFCESGYCLEGKDLRWIKNYYFRPIKRLIKNLLLPV